jgi:hypothetical protein
MFFFEQTFQTVLNGIDAAGGPMGAITNIANAILLLCALFAVYEAYARGGDARMIGIAAAKFLILARVDRIQLQHDLSQRQRSIQSGCGDDLAQ